jgi:hypothetical protein
MEESAQRDWKGVVNAVLGSDCLKWTDKEWEENSNAIWDENQFEGVEMVMEAVNSPTKAGNDFTVHNWKREPTAEDRKFFGLVQ